MDKLVCPNLYMKKYIGMYDPFNYSMNITNVVYDTPYLIFKTKDDSIVNYKYAEQFVIEKNRRGGNLLLQLIENGGHKSEPIETQVVTYSFMNK